MHSHLEGSLQAWSMPWGLTASLAAIATFYIWCWWRGRHQAPVPWSKVCAFLGSLVSLWIALGSPLEHLSHRMLTGHMLQHLLLMVIAAPMILLGAPIRVVAGGLPEGASRSLGGVLGHRWIRTFGRTVTHPVFCLLAASLTLIAWHLPVLFELGMRSAGWHTVQQASFFFAGLLLWWPVVQPWPSVARWPRWAIPLYLFFATLPCDALSAFLTFYDHAVYRGYQAGARNLSPLADQQLAGAMMWFLVTVVYLLPAAMITLQMLSPASRHAGIDSYRSSRADDLSKA